MSEPKDLLPTKQRFVIGLGHARRSRQLVNRDAVLVKPPSVWLPRGNLSLDLGIVHDPTLLGVYQEHSAGLEPALEGDILRRDVEHPDLGRKHNSVVLGHIVARRAEAVPVQNRANEGSVRKSDCRRSVPRLHQRGVVVIEILLQVVHALVTGPRLRDQHHDGVRKRPARHHQQLQHIVQSPGVTSSVLNDGNHIAHRLTEEGRLKKVLTRPDPVQVAAHGVDLPVVRDHSVGMCEPPCREGVGAEPLMHEAEGAGHSRIHKIRKVDRYLVRRQHSLVHNRAGR